MARARPALIAACTGLAWGLSPWLADGGLLVFAAALGWARLLPRHPGWGALAGLLGSALHLAWLPTAWRDGVGGSPWGPVALAVLLQAGLPALACALVARTTLPRPVALGLGFAAAAGLSGLQPLPVGHALLLAEDTHAWLWPAGLGGAALLTGLVAAWGGWAHAQPLRAAAGLVGWAALGAALPALPDRGEPVRVGLIQPDVDPLTGRTPSQAPAIAARVRALLEAARAADLRVTPEGAWPTDPGLGPGARRDALLRALGPGPPTLLGATAGAHPPRRNRILAIEAGELTGWVDKSVLVPAWERSVLGLGADRYQAGSGRPWIRAGGHTVGVLICYEDLFPAQVRAAGGADLLLAAAHDGWTGRGAGRRAHFGAARLAAATTGTWVLRPTLDGRSAVFDRWGRAVWSAPVAQAPFPDAQGQVAVIEVRAGPGGRPGARLDPAISLGAALVLWRRRRRPMRRGTG